MLENGNANNCVDTSLTHLVQHFPFAKIPKHRNAVFATAGAESTVWADSDGVEVTVVSLEGKLEFASFNKL